MFRRVFIVVVLAVAACRVAQSDVKEARDARYRGDTAEIFRELVDVVGAAYPIKAADPARLEIVTAEAAFEADGTMLAYSVVLTPGPAHRVQVLTHVQRDDGEDPAWVGVRTERLILAIHERLSRFEIKVDPGEGWR